MQQNCHKRKHNGVNDTLIIQIREWSRKINAEQLADVRLVDEWRIFAREVLWLPLFSRPVPLKFDVRRARASVTRRALFVFLPWVLGRRVFSVSLIATSRRCACKIARREDSASRHTLGVRDETRGKLVLREEQSSRELARDREVETHHTIQPAARPWLTMRARNWRFHLARWFLKGSSHDLFKVASTRWRRKHQSTRRRFKSPNF